MCMDRNTLVSLLDFGNLTCPLLSFISPLPSISPNPFPFSGQVPFLSRVATLLLYPNTNYVKKFVIKNYNQKDVF